MISLAKYKGFRAIITNIDYYYVGTVLNVPITINFDGSSIGVAKLSFNDIIDDYLTIKDLPTTLTN